MIVLARWENSQQSYGNLLKAATFSTPPITIDLSTSKNTAHSRLPCQFRSAFPDYKYRRINMSESAPFHFCVTFQKRKCNTAYIL